MFSNYSNKQQKTAPRAGLIAISDGGVLQMKLCWKDGGDVASLVKTLRDKCIVGPADIFQKAIEFGFEGVLLLTRTGRITEDGASEDPSDEKQQDFIRKDFHKDTSNPFGLGNSLFMDMSGEFEAARKAESAKAKRR